MREKSEKSGVIRAAMRIARAAFCVFCRPAAVICVLIPAALPAIQMAADLDFVRPAAKLAELVVAAPARAQTPSCGIREEYKSASGTCGCLPGHMPHTESSLTICQLSEVIARAAECAAQGWRSPMGADGRIFCGIQVVTADDVWSQKCEWDTGLASTRLCRDIFGRLPSDLTDEDRELYPLLEEQRAWRFTDGKHILLPRNENLGEQRYRHSCPAGQVRDPNFRPPGVQQCVCNPKTHSTTGNGDCVPLSAALSDMNDCPAQLRVTNEETGACAGCLPGHAEEEAEGICRPTPDCAAVNRRQGSDPFVCGACQAGYVYLNNVCRKPPDCVLRNRVPDGAVCGACIAGHTQDAANPGFCRENLNCAAVHRAQSGPFACGACVSGFTDADGLCRPHADCAPLNRVQATPLTCGDCAAGYAEIGSSCVPARGLGTCGAQFRAEPDSGGECGACLPGFMEISEEARAMAANPSYCFPGPCPADGVNYSPEGACYAEPPETFDEGPEACTSRNFNYARFWESHIDEMENDPNKSIYECTSCAAGFYKVDGACLPARACAEENRAAESAHACGACLPGFAEVGGGCEPRLNCAEIFRLQINPAVCGQCEAGAAQTPDGACAPTANFNSSPANGTLVARVQNGAELFPGDAVTVGTPAEFTATPDAGFYVSGWTGACAGEAHGGPEDAGAKTCRVSLAAGVVAGAIFADINECAADYLSPNAHSCGVDSVCANTVGSYECACGAGRVPVGFSTSPQCVDVNECELQTHACGSASNCVNTLGGHICACQSAGWRMTVLANGDAWCGVPVLDKSGGKTRTLCAIAGSPEGAPDCAEVFGDSLDFPAAADHVENSFYAYNCPGGKMPDAGGLNCVCPPGQEDIGGVCDVDECAATASICGGGASCVNLASTYACACKPGYVPGPGATVREPQCVPASLEPAAVPGAPVIPRPAAADLANEIITIFWGPPADVSGGEILQYRMRRSQTNRINPVDPVQCDSDQTRYFLQPSLEVFIDANVFTRAVDVRGPNPYGVSHGICYRWHIAARTAAGWGPESVTNPVLSRPADTCPEGTMRSLFGNCVASHVLEGADWCRRLNKHLAPYGVVVRLTYDANQTDGGDEYDFSCLMSGATYDCDGRVPPARRGDETLCPLENGLGSYKGIYCGALSEYRSDHRECMCRGYAEETSVTLSAIGNIRGKTDCACGVSGANANCECPAGMKHRPDLNACRNECAAAGWTLTNGGARCDIPVRDGKNEVSYPACAMSRAGAGAPDCDEVFGANTDFPLKADHTPGTFYAYNCPGGQAPNAAGTACACPERYAENETGVCVNIDECAAGVNDCPGNATCENTAGGHICRCPFGRTFSGGECLCDGELSAGACLPAFSAGVDNCTNSGWPVSTANSQVSSCHVPIRDASATVGADRGTCDISAEDEARAASQALCEDVFPDFAFPLTLNHNAGDRYVYNCPHGRSADFKTCNACPDGQREKADGTCEDIDECATEAANSCGSAANNQCVNTAGGYECACDAGHARLQLDDRSECADIDECKLGVQTHGCGIDAACANTIGGHTCACQAAGWNLTVFADGGAACGVPVRKGESGEFWQFCNLSGAMLGAPDCAEVFGESLDFPHQASHAGGFYIYGCPDPQVVGADRQSCVCPPGTGLTRGQYCAVIDECGPEAGACQENASCARDGQSRVCACNPGYVQSDLNGQARCVEVDECATGAAACGDNAICFNTAGSYECACDAPECAGRESVLIARPVNGTIVGRHGDFPALTGPRHYLPLGTAVTFSATPAANHYVSAWTGDCAGASADRACALAVRGEVRVGALFAPINLCNAAGGRLEHANGDRQCVCPVREIMLESGVCGTCPPGEGIVAGGVCGACPVGGGILPDGRCGAACPDGHLSINNVCQPEVSARTLPGMALTLYNLLEAELASDINNFPTPENGLVFTIAIREFQQGILDRHSGKADYLGDLEGFETDAPNRRPAAGGFGRFFSRAEDAGFPPVDRRKVDKVLSQIPIRVAGAQQCLNAGWDYSTSGEICGIPLTLAGGGAADQCHLSGGAWPQCADAFGAGLTFPPPTLSATGATLRFVYNCDPTGRDGFVPAAANTAAATECVCIDPEGCGCPDGEKLIGGVCLPAAVADQCRAAGWTLLADEGACGIPLILWGGGGSDRCYLSGSARPQCEEVFGARANRFPPPAFADNGATLRFVYNCDPTGETGFIPAKANTFAATECVCPAGKGVTAGGVCGVCPAGEGTLADGLCGVCPSGDVPVNNVCLPAATTHTLPGRALTLYNLLEGDLAPGFRSFPNTTVGLNFTLAIKEYQQGILDRHNGKADYVGNLEDFERDIEDPERRSAAGAYGRFFSLAMDAGFPSLDRRSAALLLSKIPIRVAGAQKCLDAGWDYSISGESCGVPLTLSGGSAADQCRLSGGAAPQCADVFGTRLDFPPPTLSAAGATLGFVYDCDPDGSKRQIPSTINTVAATECACAIAEQNMAGGVCLCPAGQGLLADRTCGVCPAGQSVLPGGFCGCPAERGVLDGACAVCPDQWVVENGACVPGPAVIAAASATLLAEVQKTSPDLAVALQALSLRADPDIATDAGVPVLVVAATLLHAEVVGALISAGANPSVKVAGVYDPIYNPESASRFIPEALIQLALRDNLLVAEPRLTGTFFRFGDAAGGRFDWQAAGANGRATGDLAFAMTERLHWRVSQNPSLRSWTPRLEAVLRYILGRGAACPRINLYDNAPVSSALCARPTCPATSSKTHSCSECAGFPLRDSLRELNGGTCVAHCGRDKFADTTTWPDSQCLCAREGDADEFGCPSEFDAALIREVRKPSPDLAAIRALLDRRANPNVASGGIPLLVVAATLLHAEAVRALITAGADPLVKVDGIVHPVYNPHKVPRFIPEALVARGLYGQYSSADISLRLADVFVRFGDAAGDRFDWRAKGMNGHTTGDLAFGLIDAMRRRAEETALRRGELPRLRTMARHLVERGAACPTANLYDNAPIPSGALCDCPAGQGAVNGVCAACPGGQIVENGRCVADPANIPSANATLAAEIQKTLPDLAAVREALDAGANPDHAVDGRPALLTAGRLGHAKIVSVLVTAGANVNARDANDDPAFDNRDFGHHAAERLSFPGFPTLRAARASLLYYFGGALDVRNAMFEDANYDWNLALDGDRMLDRLANTAHIDAELDSTDNFNILQDMADYAILRGARCAKAARSAQSGAVCSGSAEAQRLLAQAALAAEVEKPAGAAQVSVVAALLSGAGAADPNGANSAGRPLLIAAARNGHAQIVSVLVTAGADVNATDPTFLNMDAAQHAAAPLTDPAAGPRALRASVLYYFGGALDVRNAMFGDADFDWNRAAAGGDRLLDLLVLAQDQRPRSNGENENVIYHMADYALARGATCGDKTTDRARRRVCFGSARIADARASLVAEVEKPRGEADAAAVVDLLNEESVTPNIEDSSLRPLLILAARNGHAEIVSVLVTAGADVNAADATFRGFGAVHHAAAPLSGANAGAAAGPRALRASVLYYFGGALDVRNAASGDANFDWNRADANGFRPLDLLAESSSRAADAADALLLQEMADYLTARGAECGGKTADHSRLVCRGTLQALLDEVEKPAGAADAAVFSRLLDNRAANPDHADSHGRSLLILAARNGHAKLVSVLAVAGANVNATDPTFADANAAHHLAAPLSDPAAGPRALRASVLYHFGGGLDARKAAFGGARFNWNRADANGRRPLDILVLAEDESPQPAGENVAVIRQMADYMLARGANCGGMTTDKTRRVCAGNAGISGARASLLAEVKKPRGEANAAAVLDLLDSDGSNPDIEDPEGTPILIVAATIGHAEIVSVLVAAGANPEARLRASVCDGSSIGRAVPHLTAQNNFGAALYYTWGTALNVLRHFADAVNQVGASYDWNARGVAPDCVNESRAPDFLRSRYDNISASLPEENVDDKRTAMGRMAGILIFNGASCENQANKNHITCAGPPPAVTLEYGEIPPDQSGGALTASVPSGGITLYGARPTFTAIPVNGWELSAWEGDAGCPPSDWECVVAANSDNLRVTARFSPAPRIAYASDPSDESGGRVTIAGADGSADGEEFAYSGGTVTFTAIPENGWELSAWEGDVGGSGGSGGSCVASDLECVLTANDDLRVTALFSPAPRIAYASDPSNESGGRVTIVGADGSADGEDFVYSGGTVTFTAIPENGWEFSAWEGDVGGSGGSGGSCDASDLECVLTANDDLRVTARFSPAPRIAYASDPSDESGGRVTIVGADGSADGEDFVYSGGTVTFTAIPENGWEFSAWEGGAGCPPSDLECVLTANDDLRVTARFSPAPRIAYASDPSDESGGRVTIAGADGSADGEDFVYSGGTVTFTAIPENGWELSAWEGGAGCPPADWECVLTANDDLRVTARFSPAPRIEYASDPSDESGGRVTIAGADGSADGEDFAYSGGMVTFTAIPENGWELSAWEGGAGCPPADWECVLTANDDLRVTARFSPAPRIAYASDPSDESRGRVTIAGADGSADGGDFVYSGGTVTFTAIPANGWERSAWTGDCAGVAGNACAVVATLDVSAGATFTDIDECAIDTDNCAADGGRCDNTEGGFACGCVAGYSGDGRTCDADKTVSFQPPANGTLSAAGAGGAVQDGDTTTHGTTITFTAAPASGYRFSVWFGDCAGDLSCKVVATLHVSVGATFADIDECRANTHDCAADGGFCDNTEGGFACSCIAGYAGDGRTCDADKTVSFQPPANGTLSAASAGGAVQDGDTTAHGTTITFTAAPNRGWQVSAWFGDCAGTNGGSCEAVATLNVSAGVTFADIDECQTNAHDCAAGGGFCDNTEGGFVCGCVAGYSGDGRSCDADKTVSFQPPANGTLSAKSAGASMRNGQAMAYGTTITFTAAPDHGYRLSAWLGDCAGDLSCEVIATLHVSVGAVFADIDECQTNTHDCAADGGRCDNTEGGFACGCAAGYAGDGRTCDADKTVSFQPPANGTLYAESAGVPVRDGDAVTRGTTITFTAAPDAAYQLSMWTGACAGTSADASAESSSCETVATLDVSVGAAFAYIGRCAAPGHLLFGAPPNLRCAPPTICPADYAADNDCLPAAPAKADSSPLILPDAANLPNACERVFGGRMRSAGGGPAMCSNVDHNGTFCIVGSRAAFPCQGLFKHVWQCNTYNRPALNMFFCGARCEGGTNMVRGRECGKQALDAPPFAGAVVVPQKP